MGNQVRFFMAALALLALSCQEDAKPEGEPAETAAPPQPAFSILKTPAFNADSAYAFIEAQVAFGPRVPNTAAHEACAQWLTKKLKSYGLTTNVQEATVRSYNDQPLNIFNIMGQYNPGASKRILLCAHWDSRPYADRDDDRRSKPIDGANDGASGVGVLLEIARILQADTTGPEIGVDIVFFDAEDYGKPEGSMIGTSNNSWCLGSQHWSKNLPIANYDPAFGILLDMVGAANAQFPKEGVSMYYAPHIVNRVWKIAHAMGHDDYFKNFRGSEITDDHLYLNQLANIPTIDIIHYEMGRGDFGSFHHTHEDNMDIIDRTTLGVVGNVVTQVLYQEAL